MYSVLWQRSQCVARYLVHHDTFMPFPALHKVLCQTVSGPAETSWVWIHWLTARVEAARLEASSHFSRFVLGRQRGLWWHTERAIKTHSQCNGVKTHWKWRQRKQWRRGFGNDAEIIGIVSNGSFSSTGRAELRVGLLFWHLSLHLYMNYRFVSIYESQKALN